MTTFTRESVIKPGLFGDNCAADTRRMEFDFCNESLLVAGVKPDFLFIGDSITWPAIACTRTRRGISSWLAC